MVLDPVARARKGPIGKSSIEEGKDLGYRAESDRQGPTSHARLCNK